MYKSREINKILKTLANVVGQISHPINDNSIYHYLTRYKINKIDQDFKVNDLFSNWINYFKDNKNIIVFVQENWKYFCRFMNSQNKTQKELRNPIKMYISVDSKHIEESARLIFEFMTHNNIIHESKIGSDIRTDDIVLRVFSKKDSEKVHNFIINNHYIKEGMNEVLPFCFEKDGIGYALDGRISYNQTLANYLANYLNDCKKNNSLKKVSIENFYEYIFKIYVKVFINKEGIEEYLRNFTKQTNDYLKEEVLNNYYEVTFILLSSLKGEKFDKFMNHVDYFNDPEQLKNRINFYRESVKEEVNDSDKKLFDEYIMIMLQKYNYKLAYTSILEYLKTGNVERITKTNNLRERFLIQMNNKKCSLIMENLSLDEYIAKIIDRKEDKLVNIEQLLKKDKDLFNEYIIVMYQKYDNQTAYSTILEYVKTGNLERVTRSNNLRERFSSQMKYERIKDIIGDNLNNYISNVLGNKLVLTKVYLDKAIVETYKELNDLEHVIIAVNNACYGDYRYFINKNKERDLLARYVDNNSIILLLKQYANGVTKDYVLNCLENYSLNGEQSFTK